MKADDSLDIWAVHGIGGIVGNILTAFFAADYIAHLDGYSSIPGGWLNGHYIQLAYQLADSVSAASYSFVMSTIILLILKYLGNVFPALQLRASEDEEELGIDDVEIGEFAYDYVEVTREVKASAQPSIVDSAVGEDSEEKYVANVGERALSSSRGVSSDGPRVLEEVV